MSLLAQMIYESRHQARPLPKVLGRGFESYTEFRKAVTGDVLQLSSLEVIPDQFHRIEVRCISRQSFKLESASFVRREEICHGRACVDGAAVPDDQQRTSNELQQVPQ